jgi:hypothetical protein
MKAEGQARALVAKKRPELPLSLSSRAKPIPSSRSGRTGIVRPCSTRTSTPASGHCPFGTSKHQNPFISPASMVRSSRGSPN